MAKFDIRKIKTPCELRAKLYEDQLRQAHNSLQTSLQNSSQRFRTRFHLVLSDRKIPRQRRFADQQSIHIDLSAVWLTLHLKR